MPPMKCCGKTWSVSSDDFVITSIIAIIFHTTWLGGLIAFALAVLVQRDCFPDGPRKMVVFAFIYSQIATQALVIFSEVLVASVSSRGTVTNDKPRRFLPHFLRIRALLYALEILGIVFGGYVAWNPYIQDHIDCERSNRVSQAIEAYEISLIVVHVIVAVLFMIYFDPLGLQTPSLLKELRVSANDDCDDVDGDYVDSASGAGDKKKGLYRTSTWKLWGQRAKLLCCCVRGNKNNSKVQALEDIAHAMATLFDDVDIVPTDFVAGLMLVHRDQKKQLEANPECDLGAPIKKITYDHMKESKEKQLTSLKYQRNSSEDDHKISPDDIKSQLEDIRHYLKFALGIYGWPVHVYMNPLVGSLCLCAHLKCRVLNKQAKDFVHDNCCLANTVALQLRSKLNKDHVICTSYKNEVHQPPYSLCYDGSKKIVVLSIRGSMSLRDVLTDMNMSMRSIEVDDESCRDCATKVHSGMYQAAKYIKDEIDVKLRELHNRGYKLIITGHSLGAGVGAILAVLYWKEFHNLHCYAFSPPGSLFTLPLVEYSKPFITTVICGNDIVPRLTFRSLLYLKRNIMHHLKRTDLPKHAILFPKLFYCCYRQHHNHANHSELSDGEVYKLPQDEIQTPKKIAKVRRNRRKTLHKFVQDVHTAEETPAYVPGKVLYIRERKPRRRIRRRFWNIIGEKELYAEWMPNVEFSHIIVDKGMFHDHMPHFVQRAVEHLYQQLSHSKETDGSHHMESNRTNSNINGPSVQCPHSSAAKHDQLEEVSGYEPDEQEEKWCISQSKPNNAVADTLDMDIKIKRSHELQTVEVMVHQERKQISS